MYSRYYIMRGKKPSFYTYYTLYLTFLHFIKKNKGKNVHRFELSAIRGELLEREREKEKERSTQFEEEASMDHQIGEGLG